ncbi:hypothetical protein E1218_17800 [Kribbella turkmenica]|uniref:beta-N-acetylhexosaminidase n=2 Tax=Kribbella turkmenica TaxID=2530375 RepID=A0A4V2YFK2_9ACTN|nr:hypothetical protein E1218_17800 [Kribbella turkmenica]
MSLPMVDQTERWIDEQLGRMTPAQKLAQRLLVLPGVDAGRPDAATCQALELGVGALHSVTGMPASAAARYHNAVARICADAAVPPALISGNLESGVAYSLGTSGTHLPYPRGVGLAGDAEVAYRVAAAGAVEARSVGYHWTFSPCVDVISVPDDPILGVRAYGVPAPETAELGSAQIRGYQDHGVLATAKHFPGHGDSTVDSHLGLPRITRSRAAYEADHLPPFRAAVEAGVATVMVAHLVLPELGVAEPASLSARVNRGWLRSELGFTGVIVTDSLRMAAIADSHQPATAALLALRAGADVANVKCPAELAPQIVEHLLEAMADGALDETELDDSVRRLLVARARIGLDTNNPVDENRAAGLDAALAWNDETRAGTVSIHPAGRGPWPSLADGGFVVVGDSPLARRLVELGSRRGLRLMLEPDPLAEGILTRVAARHPGRPVVPVFCPRTDPVAHQRESVHRVTADAPSAVAAVVVNSVSSAEYFGEVGHPVVTTPAVDAFGIVTDAAVDATLDVLCR